MCIRDSDDDNDYRLRVYDGPFNTFNIDLELAYISDLKIEGQSSGDYEAELGEWIDFTLEGNGDRSKAVFERNTGSGWSVITEGSTFVAPNADGTGGRYKLNKTKPS